MDPSYFSITTLLLKHMTCLENIAPYHNEILWSFQTFSNNVFNLNSS